MFQKTQWHLTAWYAGIALTISGIFSLLIYLGISFQLDRLTEAFTVFQNYPELVEKLPPPAFVDHGVEFLPELRFRLVLLLVVVNSVVVCIAGLAGYFLAKKTLQPIAEMVEDQKRFISDASHEIKTPLAALRSSIEAEMLDRETIPTRLFTMMQTNLKYIASIETLTHDLLKLTRYQRQQPLSFDTVLIIEVVQDAIHTVTPLAQKKHITITHHLQELKLHGNYKMICELLVILLDNAIKFSRDDGTVEVIAKRQDSMVFIEVIDHGIGIPKEKLPFIFNRFYQVESSRSKNEHDGFGLGLSIAKSIVDSHKGTIRVESAEGTGTHVSVAIPQR